MIKRVFHNGICLAMIITADHRTDGWEFLTDGENSMQIAAMGHSAGHLIAPHRHPKTDRHIHDTREILIVRSGAMRVDFYDADDVFVVSETLRGGDIIFLNEGGHGFEILEDCQFVEVKQGPYLKEGDKIRFEGRRAD